MKARVFARSCIIRICLNIPHGREVAFAGCDARSEERRVLVPLKRQATPRRAPRLQTSASETRLMRIVETGSSSYD